MRRHESGTGAVTERLPVELTVDEARAFAEAWEHIEPRLRGVEHWPIMAGLRRIAKAYRVEFPEGA